MQRSLQDFEVVSFDLDVAQADPMRSRLAFSDGGFVERTSHYIRMLPGCPQDSE
jgi:hypothetical protein